MKLARSLTFLVLDVAQGRARCRIGRLRFRNRCRRRCSRGLFGLFHEDDFDAVVPLREDVLEVAGLVTDVVLLPLDLFGGPRRRRRRRRWRGRAFVLDYGQTTHLHSVSYVIFRVETRSSENQRPDEKRHRIHSLTRSLPKN